MTDQSNPCTCLSVADFVLKNAPFLSFVRLKNAPLVLKNAPFVCSRMPLFLYLEGHRQDYSNTLLSYPPRYLPMYPLPTQSASPLFQLSLYSKKITSITAAFCLEVQGSIPNLFFPLALTIEDIYPPEKCPPMGGGLKCRQTFCVRATNFGKPQNSSRQKMN